MSQFFIDLQLLILFLVTPLQFATPGHQDIIAVMSNLHFLVLFVFPLVVCNQAQPATLCTLLLRDCQAVNLYLPSMFVCF